MIYIGIQSKNKNKKSIQSKDDEPKGISSNKAN